jgi:hypothetical protein
MAPHRLPLPIKPRRATTQAAQALAAPRKAAVIEGDRNRLVGELMRLREVCAEPAGPVQTALILLTSKWAAANWRARERLITAADWLLHLESRRGA